jgi:hypothetical protein
MFTENVSRAVRIALRACDRSTTSDIILAGMLSNTMTNMELTWEYGVDLDLIDFLTGIFSCDTIGASHALPLQMSLHNQGFFHGKWCIANASQNYISICSIASFTGYMISTLSNQRS